MLTPETARALDTTKFIEDDAPVLHNIAVLLQFQIELLKETTALLGEIKQILDERIPVAE